MLMIPQVHGSYSLFTPQSAYNGSHTDNVPQSSLHSESPHRKAAQRAFGSSFTMCFESPKGFGCPLFNVEILFLLVYVVMVVLLAVLLVLTQQFSAFYTPNDVCSRYFLCAFILKLI